MELGYAWRPVRYLTLVILLVIVSLVLDELIKNYNWFQLHTGTSVGGRSQSWGVPNSALSIHQHHKKPYVFEPLPASVIDAVQHFVFFIGYARSSHSIIGSLLDAHPNVVIAKQTHWSFDARLHQSWAVPVPCHFMNEYSLFTHPNVVS